MFEAGLLKGETLLVTGGGSGLGLALCEKLVALGARVHICGRRRGVLDEAVEKLSSPGGAGVVAHTVDIRDAAAVDAMCQAIFADGPLTGLVNNAAANFISPTERLSPRGFDAIANTVFHGTFYLTHAVGRRWIEAGTGGSVLSIVSTGIVNGAPFVVPSTMSKAAICAMTKSLAIEWGRHGIRLNAIGPGLIPTEGAVVSGSLNVTATSNGFRTMLLMVHGRHRPLTGCLTPRIFRVRPAFGDGTLSALRIFVTRVAGISSYMSRIRWTSFNSDSGPGSQTT